MKVTPLSQGSGVPAGAGLGSERMPADKIAAAKAIAAGEPPPSTESRQTPSELDGDPQLRRIKMRTKRGPPVYEPPAEGSSAAETPNPDPSSQASAVTEVTKPLSPQFAELAKQRRALQVKEREIAEREAKIGAGPSKMEDYVSKADLAANPLKIFESGVTYDQLTQALLTEQSGVNPELQKRLQKLEADIKASNERFDQTLNSRETQAEEAALTEMLYEAEALAKEGDAYEMVRERKAFDQVLRLIHSTYKKTGRVLGVPEAMSTVENQLLEESLKWASLGKVKSKLWSPPQEAQNQPLQPQQPKQMRTLTARDGTSVALDRKTRAMQAFHGTLKR